MRLFHSSGYSLINSDTTPAIATPLGKLGRKYSINSGTDDFKPTQGYQHSSGSTITQWVAPGCVLEELTTDFQGPESISSPTLTCKAVVLRVEARTKLQGFRAELVWLPGYSSVEAFGEPGEGIEARSWIGATSKVTIGIEDAEYLASRARVAKWMPVRLAPYFDQFPEQAVHVREDSVALHLPALTPGELCQLQFVIASGDSLVDDINTWCAVDVRPEVLLVAGGCE
jgi:hypothetical protein